MVARLIDGKARSEEIVMELKKQVAIIEEKYQQVPTLAVILVGENPASKVYVANKHKKALEAGIKPLQIDMPEDTSETDLLAKINELNLDKSVNGILVQLPLPKHINEQRIIDAIEPTKDVDGFHPINSGKLFCGIKDGFTPCTPKGCLDLIKTECTDLSGKNALVIGRSNIVGKPMAMLLLAENCTVTMAHSRTNNLEELCSKADIVVVGIGKPSFVKGEWLNNNAIVIDVGINRITTDDSKSKLVGDVDFESAKDACKAITPVPGGVGPMTIAMLLQNTFEAFKSQNKISF